MKKGAKKPYYGKQTKRQIIIEYLTSSASMSELSELYGVLGSNTVAGWIKKSGDLNSSINPNFVPMNKPHASKKDKQRRKKRFKTDAHFRIEELEEDLETAHKKVEFYQFSMNILNDLAKELTGVDLLKKTGQELFKRSMKQKL